MPGSQGGLEAEGGFRVAAAVAAGERRRGCIWAMQAMDGQSKAGVLKEGGGLPQAILHTHHVVTLSSRLPQHQ